MPRRISFAQNGEDVRVWHAFGPTDATGDPHLTYVEVGANEPRQMSLTAALYDLGWRGLLVEADPDIADRLCDYRPSDIVMNAAAADIAGSLTFYRVPGTGLGTMDPREARAAEERGFEVVATTVESRTLDSMLDEFMQRRSITEIHVLSIDVEGAEQQVLAGLSLEHHRPWVLCIEAVEPGTDRPNFARWKDHVVHQGYREVSFDGVNLWFVAEEHADQPVGEGAGAAEGTSIAQAIATPFHVLDIGQHGWIAHESARLHAASNRAFNRSAWQRELILDDLHRQVPVAEYERQIDELRTALVEVQGSRTYALSRSASRLIRRLQHVAQRAKQALPRSVTDRVIRERHLRHVSTNMRHLTDPAYLGEASPLTVTWADESAEHAGQRPPVPLVLDFSAWSEEQARSAAQWLTENPYDGDVELDARMDNHNDEVGRVQAALRTRLRIRAESTDPIAVSGTRVAFDARSLQTPAFKNRGIGRFALAALEGLREAVADEQISLIVDPGLHALPADITGECEILRRVDPSDVPRFGALIQPSPMTHSPDPIVPLLVSDIYKAAVVFDFIPLHYPSVYLRHAATRAEYGVCLDALSQYSEFFAISHLVARELRKILVDFGRSADDIHVEVTWPASVARMGRPAADSGGRGTMIDPAGPIIVMTGDEPRKNTFGALAGVAAATSDQSQRDVRVVGMAGQSVRVHHWSIAAAMRPGEARTLDRVSDEELDNLVSSASCVVVSSFDEGLSLPVIEALASGAPVVASDIPAHRELIGRGAYSFNPGDPRSIAKAVRKVTGNHRTHSRQAKYLAVHRHAILEQTVAARLEAVLPTRNEIEVQARPRSVRSRLSIGVATPWIPQRTGVADFSHAVFTELAALADVTLYTTEGAGPKSTPAIGHRSVQEVFDDPMRISEKHDAFISVVGNSHYHLPFIELLSVIDAIAIAHDTRMVEFYMALRGRGGVEQLMLTSAQERHGSRLDPPLDDQIDDMRLLQNAGFWEIAHRASMLVMHSPSAAPRIEAETGRPVILLPFANQRVPEKPEVSQSDRKEAKDRLGLDRYPPNTVHLASFGYVDPRTKLTDIVVESAAWLVRWGHPVALHLVGAASNEQEAALRAQARQAGLEHFSITGFQTPEQFRDWLLAVDLGIQLRISPLLGVSGPLSDLAAFGTPAVASAGLCSDVDTPSYIHRLPDAVSPVTVAEAAEQVLRDPQAPDVTERDRRAYLAAKSPQRYAQLLLELIEETR